MTDEVSNETEVLYPNRPEVVVDGKKVEHKPEIEGKSLEVYEYLAEHAGSHGVRDIQRALDYSSPSVVYYHLNKLQELKYVEQDEDSKYFVGTDAVDLGSIGSHITFMQYWVPRSLLYAISLLMMIILATIYLIGGVDTPMVWFFSFVPVLLLLSVLLLNDSIYFSRKFSHS